MKLLMVTLLSLAVFPVALTQDEPQQEVPLQTTITQDYLIQLLFNISEARIPNYLVNVIYNRPEEKSISSQAVLDLFQIPNISLESTQNILQLLNIPQAQVFSINGLNYTLELFNWTFTNFYNTITPRLNLSGVTLRNALIALQIDAAQFSSGIAYGEPDPWLEFIKGNFTQANMELACAEAGLTLETLWGVLRDQFIQDLVSYEINGFVQLLLNHGIRQEQALTIWNAVPVTTDHVYSLALYNDIIQGFIERANNQTALGVLVVPQEVVVPRHIYDMFKEERDLLDIRAQTLLTRNSLSIGVINDTIYMNLVVLKHMEVTPFENLTTINITNENSNVTDCSYVTFQNNNILTVNVPLAIFFNETYQLPRTTIQNVISGSPLVCNDTVYALTRGVEGDVIIADAFSDLVAPPSPSSSDKLITLNLLGMLLPLLLKFVIV